MAQLGNTLGGFNANEEPELKSEPIPSGEYKVIASKSEWKETKNRNGKYLKFEFEVIDGKYKGRKIWQNFNLDNPNPDAVKFARAEFATFCRAVNVPTPNDSAELHNKPFRAKVGIQQSPGYDPQNTLKGYHKLSDAPASGNGESVPDGKPAWMAQS